MRGVFPQVTVNDVLLALVTGTLRDYLAAHDDLPTGPIRTTSPAHIPASEGNPNAGNHFTTVWIDLPVHLPDPAERLVAAVMAFAGTRAFGVFPPTQNLTTSTVIGSGDLRYLGTRRITHMYARTIVCPPITCSCARTPTPESSTSASPRSSNCAPTPKPWPPVHKQSSIGS